VGAPEFQSFHSFTGRLSLPLPFFSPSLDRRPRLLSTRLWITGGRAGQNGHRGWTKIRGGRRRLITHGDIHSRPLLFHSVNECGQRGRGFGSFAVDSCGKVENRLHSGTERRVPGSEHAPSVDNFVNVPGARPHLSALAVGNFVVNISTRLTTTTTLFNSPGCFVRTNGVDNRSSSPPVQAATSLFPSGAQSGSGPPTGLPLSALFCYLHRTRHTSSPSVRTQTAPRSEVR